MVPEFGRTCMIVFILILIRKPFSCRFHHISNFEISQGAYSPLKRWNFTGSLKGDYRIKIHIIINLDKFILPG